MSKRERRLLNFIVSIAEWEGNLTAQDALLKQRAIHLLSQNYTTAELHANVTDPLQPIDKSAEIR